MPADFARDNGLDVETPLMLIHPDGIDVPTEIRLDLNQGGYRSRVHDWPVFTHINGMEIGRTCVFEYNQNTQSLILLEII